jgi:hypothetical protein
MVTFLHLTSQGADKDEHADEEHHAEDEHHEPLAPAPTKFC